MSSTWPEYCCAILRDGRGRYLLERRAADARDAPGKLACFGGKREDGEHPDRCIRREIKEEVGWSIGALKMDVAVRLLGKEQNGKAECDAGFGLDRDRVIAWFYRGNGPREGLTLRTLPGSAVVWASAEEILGPLRSEMSAWHLAAIEAERRGEGVARAP